LPNVELLLETSPGSELASFRCPAWPPDRRAVVVKRVANHENRVLTDGGSIGSDCGQVRQVAGGGYRVERKTADRWQLLLDDGTRLMLSRGPGASWMAEIGQTA
jgi:hypothetical protein